MNPFEMLFVPMVLFMVIVAPTWIVMGVSFEGFGRAHKQEPPRR